MDLSKILKINQEKIIRIQNLPIKSLNHDFNLIPISTDSKNLDSILGGGFFFGKPYLIFGANSTGKTQLIHQLCIQAYKKGRELNPLQTPENIKMIYYLDTENTFRPERIKELASTRNIEYSKILKSILVANVMSNSALLMALKNIEEQLNKDENAILFIDSINNYYRSEQGNENLSFHQIKNTFMQILNKLYNLNKKFNICIIATAQVAPNFIDDALIENIPVGNQYLNHFFSEYLYLSQHDQKNYAHLVNSSKLPEKKVPYKITSEGIIDFKI